MVYVEIIFFRRIDQSNAAGGDNLRRLPVPNLAACHMGEGGGGGGGRVWMSTSGGVPPARVQRPWSHSYTMPPACCFLCLTSPRCPCRVPPGAVGVNVSWSTTYLLHPSRQPFTTFPHPTPLLYYFLFTPFLQWRKEGVGGEAGRCE